jgi:hypothetical protein
MDIFEAGEIKEAKKLISHLRKRIHELEAHMLHSFSFTTGDRIFHAFSSLRLVRANVNKTFPIDSKNRIVYSYFLDAFYFL